MRVSWKDRAHDRGFMKLAHADCSNYVSFISEFIHRFVEFGTQTDVSHLFWDLTDEM